jgi:hypothetical protein
MGGCCGGCDGCGWGFCLRGFVGLGLGGW